MTFNQSNKRYERITRALLDEPWAILPSKLEAIAEFITLKAQGGTLTDAEIAAIRADAPPVEGRRSGAIAVLPIFGTLHNRANMITEASGGTSVEMLSRQFGAFVTDPDVAAIVLDIDSPGGSVAGISEFAEKIHAARDVKPVVAVANTLAVSAAYWLGSAATELIAAPSAMVGSIGALMVHEDHSAEAEKAGVSVSFIHAGKYKVEGNPYEPLGDDARAFLQARVDEAYADFTGDVARFRGANLQDVQGAAYGEGRVLTARKAIKTGMVDRIETLDAVLARLMKPQGRGALRREPRSEYGLDPMAAVIERLDRIEALLPQPTAETTPEPVADEPELVIDPEALATAVAEILKGDRL